ncbi:cytosolic beta-glucosidase-like [Agrilus planipennis]|uniref:Cytosolic beta-glucosidase-like n=1 Tax=Agrilus planipennis TaxID=224129 RepID=A0A1W4W7W6_AGRPL|nr:cytosolic beta-glucosidase-like [Agrilus planipennis]
MGISTVSEWNVPGSPEDEEAVERARQFKVGMYTNPIFSTNGDYPQLVKDLVAKKSALEGFSKSRLPEFTSGEIEYIKGTSDFFGLNHYTTRLTKNSPATDGEISFHNDMEADVSYDPSWPMDPANRFAIIPWGFRRLLAWIKSTYNNPVIHVTESGSPDYGGLEDKVRISYIGQYLEALLEAINQDNVHVQSYSVWSLMDNFAWNGGYLTKIGLHYVNFTDPDRPRIPKLSATYYKNIIASRVVGDYPPLS